MDHDWAEITKSALICDLSFRFIALLNMARKDKGGFDSS